MNIIKSDRLPPFWWLNPWACALRLHKACAALKALSDRQDDLLQGRYSPRPRWTILQTNDDVPRYYFHDTDPDYFRGKQWYEGKACLYDGPSKSHVFEYDAAKAIERLNKLNADE